MFWKICNIPNKENVIRPVTTVQKDFIEAFGNLYSSYGWKRLDGLIIGLLIARAETLSLDEICEALGRSKGPISETVRHLSEHGLIHKVGGEEHRRNYYTVDHDVFFQNHLRNMQTVRKNRSIAEQYLQMTANSEDLGGMRHHLRTMHSFYTLMESFFSEFSARWLAEHASSPEQDGVKQNEKENG